MRYSGNAPVKVVGTSLGAHVRALAEVLCNMIADEQERANGPSERVVRMRGHLHALQRAYPQFLAVSEVDLAQAFAEEDGEEIHDAP